MDRRCIFFYIYELYFGTSSLDVSEKVDLVFSVSKINSPEKSDGTPLTSHSSLSRYNDSLSLCLFRCRVGDPYREGQISAIDRVQKKAVKFVYHTNSANWETLTTRRKLSCLCALFKAYSGERAWKEIGDRLKRPHYLSRVDHNRKIRSRRQRTDIGKYSFMNRTIQHWNQLPDEVLETLPRKPATFKRRARKVLTEVS